MARKRLMTPMGSTRGHAIARANMMSSAHPSLPALHPAPLTRRSIDDSALFTPYRPSLLHHHYDTTGHDNYTRSEVNRELFSSSAAMQDNFDIAHRSRNRDKEVLSAANRAIVDTEIHATPRSAVAARRAVRGQSTPPTFSPPHVEKKEVDIALARARTSYKRYCPPPASVRRPRVIVKPSYTVTPRYRTYRPRSTRYSAKTTNSTRYDVSSDTVGQRRAPLSILEYLRHLETMLLNKSKYPVYTPYRPYVPHQRTYRKAALLANKVEITRPERKRRPRSLYAQNRLREMRTEHSAETPAAVPVAYSVGLKASKPVRLPQRRHIVWDPLREISYYKTYQLTA